MELIECPQCKSKVPEWHLVQHKKEYHPSRELTEIPGWTVSKGIRIE